LIINISLLEAFVRYWLFALGFESNGLRPGGFRWGCGTCVAHFFVKIVKKRDGMTVTL
jgi:hypothetical protein